MKRSKCVNKEETVSFSSLRWMKRKIETAWSWKGINWLGYCKLAVLEPISLWCSVFWTSDCVRASTELGTFPFVLQAHPTFSHMDTECPQCSVYCRAAAGDPKWVCKSCNMELSVATKTSSGTPEHSESSACKLWHTHTHTEKQSMFDAPEDKVCAAHFCQRSVQRGWCVPIFTAILEAVYDLDQTLPQALSRSQFLSAWRRKV